MKTSPGWSLTATNLREVLGAVGQRGSTDERTTWFTRLVTAYLHHRARRPAARSRAAADTARPEVDRANAVIRAACIKSAIGGASSGAVLTSATIITAEIPSGGFVAVPMAALGVGAEMVARTILHLDMTCDLAAIFNVSFNPDDPIELWQLYALAFRAEDHEDGEDPGKELVHRLGEVEAHNVGESIGHELLGESLLKNIVPFVGVVTSSVTNWRRTRRLGDTARRYLRYRRALHDALAADEGACHAHLDVLVEGFWFIFIADGQLSPEEATVLAGLLRKLDPALRAAVESRFVQDETEWLSRVAALPESVRPHFTHALEVAAAVDKRVSLPEQRILSRAVRALGQELDMARVEAMMKQFTEVGVLTPAGGSDE
jgi:hypothetical protein